MRQYMWLARSRPIRLLLLAWGITYAGDLAAFTVASVYLYRAGAAGYVGLLGLDAIMKPYPVRRAEPVRATDMSRRPLLTCENRA